MSNEREILREADRLLKLGDTLGAARCYAQVARDYEQRGFALKSVALWRQIRTAMPEGSTELDAEARAALIRLYRALGLEADALAVEAEGEPRQ